MEQGTEDLTSEERAAKAGEFMEDFVASDPATAARQMAVGTLAAFLAGLQAGMGEPAFNKMTMPDSYAKFSAYLHDDDQFHLFNQLAEATLTILQGGPAAEILAGLIAGIGDDEPEDGVDAG